MIPKLSKIYANEEFQRLSYDEQRRVKAALFDEGWKDDPVLQGLSQADISATYDDYVNSPPAFRNFNPYTDITPEDRTSIRLGLAPKNPLHAEYIKAYDILDRLAEQDPQAQQDAQSWIVGNAGKNESLFIKAAAGLGYLGKALASPGDDPAPFALNKTALDTMSSYMMSKMEAEEAKSAGRGQMVARLGIGLAENTVLNLVLFGNGNTLKAGVNGASTGTVGTPGIFTKWLFGEGGAFTRAAAGAKTALGTQMYQKWLPMVAEAVGGGLTDVLRSFPDLVAQGQIEGPRGFWTRTAQQFGQGFAWDLSLNVAGDLVKGIFKPFVRTFRKFDPSSSASVDALERAAKDLDEGRTIDLIKRGFNGTLDEPTLRALSPELQESIRPLAARARALTSIPFESFDTEQGLRVFAKASAGADIEMTAGGIKILRDGNLLGTAKNNADALDLLTDMARRRTSLDAEVFEEGASILGGVPTSRFQAMREVPTGFVQSRSTEELLAQIPFGVRDQTLRSQTEGVVQQLLKRAGVQAPATIAEGIPSNVLALASVPGHEDAFFRSLTDWLQTNAPSGASIPDLADVWRKSATKGASLDGVKLVVESRLGGKVVDLGGGQLQATIPDPRGGQRVITAPTIHQLNNRLGEAMVDLGVVGEEEFIQQFHRSTGGVVQPGQMADGTKAFLVRLRDGTTRGHYFSLKEISDAHPSFAFKMPEALAPRFFFEGEKVFTSSTLAAGPLKQIRSVLSEFAPKSSLMKFHWLDETGRKITQKAGVSSFTLEIPDQGFRKSFSSLKKAEAFMKGQADGFENMITAAAERGYRIDFSRSGDAIATSAAGDAVHLRSNADIKNFLSKAPDPDFATDLIPHQLGDNFSEELYAKLRGRLDDAELGFAKHFGSTDDPLHGIVRQLDPRRRPKSALGKQLKEIELTARQLFGPRFSVIESAGEQVGDPSIGRTLNDYLTSVRLTQGKKMQIAGTIERVLSPGGKNITKLESRIASKLLELPEEAWEKAARAMDPKVDMKRVHYMTRSLKALYEMGAKEFGIDSSTLLQYYKPKLRSARSVIGDAAIDETKKNEYLRKMLGADPSSLKEMNWASAHTRTADLVDFGLSEDAVHEVQWYFDTGYKNQYLKPSLDKIQDMLKRADLDPRAASLYQNMYALATNGIGTSMSSPLNAQALRTTSAIADSMRSMGKGMFRGHEHEIAAWDALWRDFATADPLAKLSSLTSHATLGFRPARALFNMMQFQQNAAPLFGPAATLRAQKELTDERLLSFFQRGLISENVFSAEAGSDLVSRFKRSSMGAQQTAEYLTRGWTIVMSNNQFDEAAEKLARGTIDLPGFVKYTKAHVLGENIQEAMLKNMKAGNIQGAKDLHSTEMVRILMGDYSRENYPETFRGLIGRAFGKFGVYPINQVDLYRRVFQNSGSNFVAGAFNLMKYAAVAYSIYNGFRAVGINYNGFKPTDPLEFSGGPLFGQMVNALQIPSAILNPDDARAQMAMKEFQQSFLPLVITRKRGGLKVAPNIPRLMMPGGLQVQSMGKAANSFSEGNYWDGFAQSLGASAVPDFVTNGFTWGW
jgi:hypothetical protein